VRPPITSRHVISMYSSTSPRLTNQLTSIHRHVINQYLHPIQSNQDAHVREQEGGGAQDAR
jgi:hypothetical protein